MSETAKKAKPKRVQRKRTKGWRMPENCVSVTRPGKWGNPFSRDYHIRAMGMSPTEASFVCYCKFRNCVFGNDEPLNGEYAEKINWIKANIEQLRGKDLACFCPLDRACHADVLLELCNKDTTP